MTTEVLCPKCTVCGNQSVLRLPYEGVEAYRAGAFVQDAFPGLSADEREVIITGTHPECWDLLFGNLDESEPMYA